MTTKNKISCNFKNGKFVVAYDLIESKDKPFQIYDRIEVKETSPYGGMICAVAITNSVFPKETVELIPMSDLGSFDGKYYAEFIRGDSGDSIAKTDLFTVEEKEREEEDLEIECTLSIANLRRIDIDENKNCEIQIEWQFEEQDGNSNPENVSDSDYIVVIPSDELENLETTFNMYAYAPASGEGSGKVSIRLAGFYQPGTECQAAYFNTTKLRRMGLSVPFTITDDVLPPLDMTDEQAVQDMKNATLRYNTTASLQYEMQDQMEKVATANDYNPLLTITPKKDKWEKMIEENRMKYELIEQEVHVELEKAQLKNDPTITIDIKDETDSVVSDIVTEAKISAAIQDKPAFLFCGAGISISPPSSSPSWWTLMSNVLEETFNAVPREHQKVARKLRTSDTSRSPEEVMETYYFILQKKLFTLFEILNEGEPNANHRVIAKMAKEGKLKAIMTTNFDEFIERALDEEGVAYKVICTANEFQDYLESGYRDFAVLKIHGTVSRPDTIVAVANHYKSGKGFGGVKSTVKQFFVKNYPTIFLGYSGWDFAHKNYQDFFGAAAENGGETIYFVKYKGAKGGPSIEKLVGRHIGNRLVIGEGILPNILFSVLSKSNNKAAQDVMKFHNGIGANVGKAIERKQRKFLVSWVQSIPEISILAILWNESNYLNESNERRQEKAKASKGELDTGIVDTTKASAYIMQLAAEFGQGVITEAEFYEKQRRATMEMTFSFVTLPKGQKDELIEIVVDAAEKNPLYSGIFGESILAMVPSYLMMTADVAPVGTPPKKMFETVTKFVSTVLYPLYKKRKKDRLSLVMYNILYSQPAYLRLVNKQDRMEADNLIKEYATKAIEEGWNDELVTDYNTKEITPKITELAYQLINTSGLVETMVQNILKRRSQQKASVDEILDGAFIIALSLLTQASHRSTEIYSFTTMTQIVQIISNNESKQIPDRLFSKLESEMNENVQPVLDILKKLDKSGKKGSSLSPKETLATFDLANAEAIKSSLKHLGDGAQTQRVRESCGYYPFDHLSVSVASYLSKKMLRVHTHIKDDRAEQQSLAILVALAEACGDIKQAQDAVDVSLAITEGKVTEVTPVGIPEGLAAMYQEQGDLEKSLQYYRLALDGIRTFVLRQKTDAIVLNAVLIQGSFDKEKALRMAFEYSPFFSDTQAAATIGPGRRLLVQQCTEWSKDLSMTLEEAKEFLTKSDGVANDKSSHITDVSDISNTDNSLPEKVFEKSSQNNTKHSGNENKSNVADIVREDNEMKSLSGGVFEKSSQNNTKKFNNEKTKIGKNAGRTGNKSCQSCAMM